MCVLVSIEREGGRDENRAEPMKRGLYTILCAGRRVASLRSNT